MAGIIQNLTSPNYELPVIDDALRNSLAPLYHPNSDEEIEVIMTLITIPLSNALQISVLPKNISVDVALTGLVSVYLNNGYVITDSSNVNTFSLYMQDPQTGLVYKFDPPSYSGASDAYVVITREQYIALQIDDPKWINNVQTYYTNMCNTVINTNNPKVTITDIGLSFYFKNAHFHEDTRVVYSTNMKVRASGAIGAILQQIKSSRTAACDFIKKKSNQLQSDVVTTLANATDSQRMSLYYVSVLPSILQESVHFFDVVIDDSVSIDDGTIQYSLSNLSFDDITIEVQEYVDNTSQTDPLAIIANNWVTVTLPADLGLLQSKLDE